MKVSIIIPAYNAEEYIKKAIDSVKEQHYPDWECIIVDDGSTDNTAKIACEETMLAERFRIWSFIENRGVSWARNFALDKAEGDAVFFLDADDWIEPNCLAYLTFLARQMPKEVGRIVSQPIIHWAGGSYSKWRMRPVGIHKPSSAYLFKNSSCDVGHVTGCLYLLDRIPKEAMRFPDIPIYEDLIFNMGIILSGISLFIAIKPVYNYLRRSNSITYSALSVVDARAVLEAYRNMVAKYIPHTETIERFDTFLGNIIQARLGDKVNEL